ncbi:MAG: alpha/beta hydrolase [Leptospiraceae bacterium]|nr:alpha/beta hydrolase [Leptospiraceae bacterium]
MNKKPGKGRKKRILMAAGLILLLVGGFQVLANTFPGIILQGMYHYYAFRAGVTSRTVSVDGYEIPYYRGGEGPTLVLVHGFGDSKISFLQTAAFLTDSYDVILLDVPGFGDTEHKESRSYDIHSQVITLDSFLKKIGAQEFYLAGNSMGGHISAAYALMHPDRVKKLALLNAAGLRVDDPVPYKPSEAPLRSVEDFDKYVGETFVREPFIPRAFKLHFVSNSIKNFHWLNRIRRDIRQGQDYILNDRAATIQTQTLILWGDSDTVVSPAHAQVWSRLLPNSVLIILDDTGHAPQYERPEDTARILKSFLL